VPDARLKKEACSQNLDSGKLMQNLKGAEDVTIFTAIDARKLPDTMKDAALNKSHRRMALGVCFPQNGGQGFSKYWVVAAFYNSKN
jgi:hypothetical protein